MRCDHARDRLSMLIDGELPDAEREILMAHAAGCPQCSRYRDDLKFISRHLRQVREPAPAKLMARMSAALAVEASEDPIALPTASALRRPIVERVSRGLEPYLRQAAVILLACLLSIAGTALWMQRTGGEAGLSHDVLAAHVRSLLQDNPVQIASLDTHTVKPWFAGRLEYSPDVKDLSSDGFRLIGGRLDFVNGQRVATLVYKRRLHQISVFVWPSGTRAVPPYAANVDGFHLLGWSNGGMSYWAVSDLNADELRELQAAL